MSSTERLANDFDRELFNLMNRADRLSDDSRMQREADCWKDIANCLNRARSHARSMMSKADRDRTNAA